MYTFNIYCFGHDLSLNKELNNKLSEFDFEFSTKINGRNWEINFPYHGGQVQGDCYSCIFGTQITDDDNNKNYIKEVCDVTENGYTFICILKIRNLIDDKEILITDEQLKYMPLPYSGTCHSSQGLTIHEPYTILDCNTA